MSPCGEEGTACLVKTRARYSACYSVSHPNSSLSDSLSKLTLHSNGPQTQQGKKWAPSCRLIIFLNLAAAPRAIGIANIYFSSSCCEGICRDPDRGTPRKHDFQPSTSTLKTRLKLVQINIYPASVAWEQGGSHHGANAY